MRSIKPYNKAGVKFLEVVFKQENSRNQKIKVECPDCHNQFIMWSTTYYQGKNTCECHRIIQDIYKVYYNMKTRCYNPKNSRQDSYINKNIKICDEWLDDYMTFQKWALANGYKKGLSIDRINNNQGYCPTNCRWTTNDEQANNKGNNIMFVINGYKASLGRLCRCYNINYKSAVDYFYKHNRNMYDMVQYLKNKIGIRNINIFNYDKDYERNLLPI